MAELAFIPIEIYSSKIIRKKNQKLGKIGFTADVSILQSAYMWFHLKLCTHAGTTSSLDYEKGIVCS